MTPLDILKAARAKIELPENWGKGTCGIDRAPDTYCAEDALRCDINFRDDVDGFIRAAELFRKVIGHPHIFDWNDAPERTHSDVLKAFDRAIELAGQP